MRVREFYRGKTLLVTGTTGFLGNYLSFWGNQYYREGWAWKDSEDSRCKKDLLAS